MRSMEITLPKPQTSPLVLPSPRPSLPRFALLLPLASAFLLWLSYFPVAAGWLIWIALVPLLTLVRGSARPHWIYLSAWLSGLAFYLASMQWLRVADPRMYATWIGLAFYCSLYFPLALYLIRFLDRQTRLPLVLSVPLVWTALEFLRSTFFGGFSWYLLAHAQHNCLPLIQIADVTGAYGVSFLIAAVNALVVEVLANRQRKLPGEGIYPAAYAAGSPVVLLVQALAVLAAMIGTIVYGYWRLGQNRMTPGPRIALIQGNLDQRIRNDSAVSEDAVQQVSKHFRDLADVAASYHPDLIVWPETSWPYEWVEQNGKPTEECRKMAEEMGECWHTPLLLGMNASTIVAGHSRRYNAAIALDRQGKFVGRYDKIHRVPFGEYVPFRDWLPFMNRLAPYDFDYSVWPGQSHTRFPLADAAKQKSTFGVLICYEDTDAEVAHSYGGGGRDAVDFLVNISNDGWFDGTSEHDEHLAVCRFRAIECRRAVARSVNMGISAVIDGNGRVLQPQELPQSDPHAHVWTTPLRRGEAAALPVAQWHDYKKVAGVLLAVIPLDNRSSFYAAWGDWLPWTCWLVLVAALLHALIRRRRDKRTITV